ncbi:aminopeptidase P N-terminal domain-containing protein [Cysteiniphilum halobium]|uniref:aminopeptidase P N-terminal domain-containing protein n=1 Tax=Cysteiniphilum halobium TaxID=2219059 RepID=UPI003F86A137
MKPADLEVNRVEISKLEYKNRREVLLSNMQPNSIAIIRTADWFERTNDTYERFRPRSSFYYLTGFSEPNAYMVLIPGRAQGQFVLFSEQRDSKSSVWLGECAGTQNAIEKYGANEAYDIKLLDEIMPQLIFGKKAVYYLFGQDHKLHNEIGLWVKPAQMKSRKGVVSPVDLIHLETLLQSQRMFKSAAELACMQKAIDITCDAIKHAMKKVTVGMFEYELEATFTGSVLSQGADLAFPPVVSSNFNGCLSHYRQDNVAVIEEDAVIMLDGGAEYKFYAADITRTFPVSGKFTPKQKAIYELTLFLQNTILSKIKPGATLDDLQSCVPQIILKGLLELDIISGDLETLIAKEAHKDFFMHNIGHWLGLDIHDEISYTNLDGFWRTLYPGMVLTAEPGIYIRDSEYVTDKTWLDTGARIEDVVLVTDSGYELLSKALPRAVNDVESFMQS